MILIIIMGSTPPPKIKWNYIKEIYIINPERWKETEMYALRYNKRQIRLSYIDYLKFFIAYHEYVENKKKQKTNEELKDILEMVQQDIENFKEKVWKE